MINRLLTIFFIFLMFENCWTGEKRLGVCCRRRSEANEDYFDFDEEQIQIDYENEPEKSDSSSKIQNQPAHKAILSSQSITSHGNKQNSVKGKVPLFLILNMKETKGLENLNKRNNPREIRLKDIPSILQKVREIKTKNAAAEREKQKQPLFR